MMENEYRLERKTDIFDIKVSRWNCYCPVFTIRGKKADESDFGEGEDLDELNRPPHGCGNKHFKVKLPSQKVLDKYGITVDEYAQVAEVLEEGLSFGRCRLCD